MAEGMKIDFSKGTTKAPCPVCGMTVAIFQHILDSGAEWACCMEPGVKRESNFAARLRRRGLTGQVASREAIGIVEDCDTVVLSRGVFRWAAGTVEHLVHKKSLETLILSGQSGLGKSTAAVWAVWKTDGLFIPREEWTGLSGWEKGTEAELRSIIEHPGVVCIDEVFVIGRDRPAESERELEVVFRITRARHEARRATILTTQAKREDILKHYHERGEALIRRADDGMVDGAPTTGGFVRCKE